MTDVIKRCKATNCNRRIVGGTKEFCDRACAAAHNREQNAREVKCAECGTTFIATAPSTLICGSTCTNRIRKRAARARAAAKAERS